jgi:L-amino acid N-acyltransferase YncA
MGVTVRDATPADADAVWAIFRAVVAAGDAFPFPDDTTREDALAYWFAPRTHVRVAEADGRVVGSYTVKPNQPGRGAHVANGAYLVDPAARGLGVGRVLGEDSVRECRRLGYRAMQFNLVVATNEPAVRLWTAVGFRVVGTVPGAFRHATRGYVDAHIMFQSLLDESNGGDAR